MELAHGLAEAPITQAGDEGNLAAIHALRKDFYAQLQEVITSSHGIKEALGPYLDGLKLSMAMLLL